MKRLQRREDLLAQVHDRLAQFSAQGDPAAGEVADIEGTIATARHALVAPADDSTYAARLNLLGLALTARAESEPCAEGVLEEAVRTLRAAVAAAPTTDEDRPTYLSNLAGTIRTAADRVSRRFG